MRRKRLFRVLDDLDFPQQMHFDLAGVFQLVLDPLGDVPGQEGHFVLADDFGLDDDAAFPGA